MYHNQTKSKTNLVAHNNILSSLFAAYSRNTSTILYEFSYLLYNYLMLTRQ